MPKPNVLVVFTDQQRPDSCGCYGQALPVTSVLDELAARGTVFENAFTVQPVCGPARAAVQTGLMPTRTGCWRNGLALPSDAQTLATRMGALGYRTGYVGKWHLASDRGPGLPPGRSRSRHERSAVPPERRGSYRDAWVAADALELTSGAFGGRLWDEDGHEVGFESYRVDAITDLALDRLRHLDDGAPFLLFVSYLEPHHQNDRFRPIGPRGWARRFRDFEVPGDLAGRLGDWRWTYPDYLACCASIDENLGRLLEALRADGRLEDTIVVFTSDHGSHFRTRNLEYKRSCHDASIRVPLVLSGPGFRDGRRRVDLVSTIDLVPTLVAAAGGDAPDLDGQPLHDESSPRSDLLIQISESQIGRALRTTTHTFSARAPGWHRLAGHRRPDAPRYVASHCYDDVADPHQRHNLVRDPAFAELRRELATRLADRILQVEGVRPRIDP